MFGLLFHVIAAGYATIDKAIRNREMMSSPIYYLEDGTPIYSDVESNKYANGEKIVSKYSKDPNGNLNILEVGSKTGRVYHDPYKARLSVIEKRNKENKDKAIKKGYLSYEKYDPERSYRTITCEISTDKYIAKLEGNKDGTYRKFYLSPNSQSCLTEIEEGDKGVIITEEEYDKLNIPFGSHFASDLCRYTYKMVNGRYELVLRNAPKKEISYKELMRQYDEIVMNR